MITLHPHPPIREKQQELLRALKEVQSNPSREHATDFLWAAARALRDGNSLGLEQIKEIFDEVYGATGDVKHNQS